MPVVRELLILFGAQVDKSSLNQADQKIKGFAGGIEKILTGAMLAGLGKGFLVLNEMGSDVEENLNVINASFDESSEAVLNWSQKFGDAAGRNRFELQETAAVLGAVLNPLMNKNAEAAAEMSMGLTELTADLGSFFNLADKDVMEKLRAGITGEAEPLKRLGIVMNEATLKAFALSKGITKNVKSMTIAEKTALRYEFILDQTQSAQGDAIKTADGWANSSKAVTSKLKELATTIGLKILPFMTRMANFTKTLISGFMNFTKGTKLLEGALVGLGAVATAIAVKMMIAFAPVIIPMLKLAAVVGLIALAVDDFLTFLDGGDSIIGRFIEMVAGPGSAAEALEDLKDLFQILKIVWIQDVIPALETLRKNIGLFFSFLTEEGIPALTNFGAEIGIALADGVLAFKMFFQDVKAWVSDSIGVLGDFASAVGAAFDAVTDLLGLDFEMKTPKNVGLSRFKTQTPALSAAFGGGSQNNKVNNQINVTVQGNASVETAGKIGNAAANAGDIIRRKTAAALRQRAS